MASKPVPLLSRTLTILRSALGWDQAEVARAVGVRPNVISDYERGQRTLTREKVEELAGVMGLPAEAVDWALSFVQSLDAVARAPGYPDAIAEAERQQVEAIAAETGRLMAEFTRSLLHRLTVQGRAPRRPPASRRVVGGHEAVEAFGPAKLGEGRAGVPELGALRAGLRREHQGGGRRRGPRRRAGGAGRADRRAGARRGVVALAAARLRRGASRQRPPRRWRPAGGRRSVSPCPGGAWRSGPARRSGAAFRGAGSQPGGLFTQDQDRLPEAAALLDRALRPIREPCGQIF